MVNSESLVTIETVKTLPKTGAASLCQQWIRCGKSRCRCATGELHGPYQYLFWREGGRLKKRYIRQHDVEDVRVEIDQRRQWRWLEREARALSRRIWREQLGELREYERWLNKP